VGAELGKYFCENTQLNFLEDSLRGLNPFNYPLRYASGVNVSAVGHFGVSVCLLSGDSIFGDRQRRPDQLGWMG